MTMKTFRLFSMAALALMMAACSSEDNALETASPAMPGKLQFTATVEAPGTGATTRTEYKTDTDAESKSIIKVAWKENDKIAAIVTNSEGKYVKTELTVSKVNDDGSATITGDITKPKDDALTVDLIYPADIVTVAADGSDYSISFAKMSDGTTLDGTLDKIAANIDYRRADDCPLTVSGDKATLTSAAKLVSKLSIWKLTLEDFKAGDKLSADKVTIKDGNGVTMVSSAASGSTVYLPVPAASGIDIAISATKGSDTYYYLKKNVTLAAGKYYESMLKMEMPIDLGSSSISGTEYTVQNGQVLTGKLANNVNIKIADNATVLLKDADINGDGTWTEGNYAGITCLGDATIILEGTNTLKGCNFDQPGISVPSGKTLTIMGSGSLTANSGENVGTAVAAGIGGIADGACGDIVIKGGTINATGGSTGGAGIGSGFGGTCGAITISGGTVNANGGYGSAGIGSGNNTGSSCGAITISGGTVTANGGGYAAGIGGGYFATYTTITISGGTVEATGGVYAAGIGGSSENGTCGTITITSGVTSVTATKGNYAPNSIGAGYNGTAISVTIEDGANVIRH